MIDKILQKFRKIREFLQLIAHFWSKDRDKFAINCKILVKKWKST